MERVNPKECGQGPRNRCAVRGLDRALRHGVGWGTGVYPPFSSPPASCNTPSPLPLPEWALLSGSSSHKGKRCWWVRWELFLFILLQTGPFHSRNCLCLLVTRRAPFCFLTSPPAGSPPRLKGCSPSLRAESTCWESTQTCYTWGWWAAACGTKGISFFFNFFFY